MINRLFNSFEWFKWKMFLFIRLIIYNKDCAIFVQMIIFNVRENDVVVTVITPVHHHKLEEQIFCPKMDNIMVA